MYTIRFLSVFFLAIIAAVSAGTNQEGLAFLAKKAEEDGVVKLDSGLMYKGKKRKNLCVRRRRLYKNIGDIKNTTNFPSEPLLLLLLLLLFFVNTREFRAAPRTTHIVTFYVTIVHTQSYNPGRVVRNVPRSVRLANVTMLVPSLMGQNSIRVTNVERYVPLMVDVLVLPLKYFFVTHDIYFGCLLLMVLTDGYEQGQTKW
jgi:hypothetical protein